MAITAVNHHQGQRERQRYLARSERGAFVSPLPPLDMQYQANNLGFGCVDVAVKGCVRICLYRYLTKDGTVQYAVALLAHNAWIGQEKLLFFTGGMDEATAREGFTGITHDIVTFDWMEGDIVLKGER